MVKGVVLEKIDSDLKKTPIGSPQKHIVVLMGKNYQVLDLEKSAAIIQLNNQYNGLRIYSDWNPQSCYWIDS